MLRLLDKQKFYTKEELFIIAESQLNNLKMRLDFLVKSGEIEQKIVEQILEKLKFKMESSVDIASDIPIHLNPFSEFLPLLPVINEDILNVSILMKLLEHQGKIGENRIPLEKIQNYFESSTYHEDNRLGNCYWLIDARINEPRFDCPFLDASETIAFAFHSEGILSRYCLYPLNTRYKFKKNYPKIILSLRNGQPILDRKLKYFQSFFPIAKPSCVSRLIN